MKKTTKPSSSVSTSIAIASSFNTTEQTARDEPEVEALPESHPFPTPPKKTCHAENHLDRMIVSLTEEITKLAIAESIEITESIENSNEDFKTDERTIGNNENGKDINAQT